MSWVIVWALARSYSCLVKIEWYSRKVCPNSCYSFSLGVAPVFDLIPE